MNPAADPTDRPRPRWQPAGALSFLGALLVFGLLFKLDFPKPMVDDLFYTGAALNLANGHDLSNPLLARQEFPGHYFFVYPPMQSCALAAWLKLFGISRFSMTAFPLFCYFIIAASTIAILRQHGSPGWLEWLAPPAVTAALLTVGLRPEPLAIAFTMAGFALFTCAPRSFQFLLPAFFLMFLGASVAPRLTIFSAALIVAAVFELRADGESSNARRWSFLVAPTCALLLSVLVFLVQIGFHLPEFWRMFHVHSHRVSFSKISLLLGFLDDSAFFHASHQPLLFLCLGLLLFAWQPADHPLVRAALFVLAAFPFVAIVGGLGAGTVWYLIFPLFLYAAAVLKSSPRLTGKLVPVLALCLLSANQAPLTTILGMVHGNIQSARGEQESAARAIRSTPEHPVLIDAATARYIYNYRIPGGFYDIEFSVPFPKSHIVGGMRPGDIYVVGPANVEVLDDYTRLDIPIPKWRPLALQHQNYYRLPDQVFIIPMEDCHGPRAGM